MENKTLRKKIFKLLKRILPILGIVIFIYIILSIGVENITSIIFKAKIEHLLLIGLLVIPVLLLTNLQWQLILKKQKINVSFYKSLQIYLMSGFFSSISPGRIGSWMKVVYLKEETKEPYGKLFINGLIFSVVSLLSFFCILTIATFLLINKIPFAFPLVIVVFTFFVLFFVFFRKKERGEKTFNLFIGKIIPKKIKPALKRFVKTFYLDMPQPKYLLAPFLIAGFCYLLHYTQIYIFAYSIGVNLTYIDFLTLCPLVTAVTFIPISPGSFGVRELTVVSIFSLYGVSVAESVVISLSGFLIIGLPIIVFGSIFAINWIRNKKHREFYKFSTKRMLIPEKERNITQTR